MVTLLKSLGALGLGLTVIPSLLVMWGRLPLETNKMLMTVGMVVWFASSLAVGRLKARAS
ncbi:MAG: hypothetical protein KA712_08190 [Myxococcales bacterium]|nr:hypothetical protein [Myxococcales bacterium]